MKIRETKHARILNDIPDSPEATVIVKDSFCGTICLTNSVEADEGVFLLPHQARRLAAELNRLADKIGGRKHR
jgi:hypothetical protein